MQPTGTVESRRARGAKKGGRVEARHFRPGRRPAGRRTVGPSDRPGRPPALTAVRAPMEMPGPAEARASRDLRRSVLLAWRSAAREAVLDRAATGAYERAAGERGFARLLRRAQRRRALEGALAAARQRHAFHGELRAFARLKRRWRGREEARRHQARASDWRRAAGKRRALAALREAARGARRRRERDARALVHYRFKHASAALGALRLAAECRPRPRAPGPSTEAGLARLRLLRLCVARWRAFLPLRALAAPLFRRWALRAARRRHARQALRAVDALSRRRTLRKHLLRLRQASQRRGLRRRRLAALADGGAAAPTRRALRRWREAARRRSWQRRCAAAGASFAVLSRARRALRRLIGHALLRRSARATHALAARHRRGAQLRSAVRFWSAGLGAQGAFELGRPWESPREAGAAGGFVAMRRLQRLRREGAAKRRAAGVWFDHRLVRRVFAAWSAYAAQRQSKRSQRSAGAAHFSRTAARRGLRLWHDRAVARWLRPPGPAGGADPHLADTLGEEDLREMLRRQHAAAVERKRRFGLQGRQAALRAAHRHFCRVSAREALGRWRAASASAARDRRASSAARRHWLRRSAARCVLLWRRRARAGGAALAADRLARAFAADRLSAAAAAALARWRGGAARAARARALEGDAQEHHLRGIAAALLARWRRNAAARRRREAAARRAALHWRRRRAAAAWLALSASLLAPVRRRRACAARAALRRLGKRCARRRLRSALVGAAGDHRARRLCAGGLLALRRRVRCARRRRAKVCAAERVRRAQLLRLAVGGWKAGIRERRKKRRLNLKALRHWAASCERAHLEAWKAFARLRRAQRQRVEGAMHWRRRQLVRFGAAGMLRAATQRAADRREGAIAAHAELTARQWRLAAAAARHWRSLARRRASARAARPPRPPAREAAPPFPRAPGRSAGAADWEEDFEGEKGPVPPSGAFRDALYRPKGASAAAGLAGRGGPGSGSARKRPRRPLELLMDSSGGGAALPAWVVDAMNRAEKGEPALPRAAKGMQGRLLPPPPASPPPLAPPPRPLGGARGAEIHAAEAPPVQQVKRGSHLAPLDDRDGEITMLETELRGYQAGKGFSKVRVRAVMQRLRELKAPRG